MKDAPMITMTGRVLTERDIEGFVAEAEKGYDVSRLKVGRRQHREHVLDEDFVILRFSDGLVVDPRHCPRRIHTFWHWNNDATCRCES